MDLALLILSILSCLASALCFIWNECMWFIRFNVAFCVARASFLKIYFPVKQSNKNKDWSTWSVLLEPCVAFPWVVCPFVPVCRCSPSRSPRGGWRTSPRSPPGPSSPHCRASAASWSWWRPRAPCRSSRWDSRRTSRPSAHDLQRSELRQPAIQRSVTAVIIRPISLATSPSLRASSHISINFCISAMVGPVKSSTGIRVCLRSGNA